jgi:hypothetical protein
MKAKRKMIKTKERIIDLKCLARATYDEETGELFCELIKHTNNTVIPIHEPTIMFRGRDRLVKPMLDYYKKLCEADGANEYQLDLVQQKIDQFEQFTKDFPEVMKQPGVTRGK